MIARLLAPLPRLTLALALMWGTTALPAAGADVGGDPAAGERVFAQRCAVCHVIARPDGETLVRGGAAGPNMYGIIGRQAGTVPGFRGYGEALLAAGKAGLVWTEAELAAFLEDPRAHLRLQTGDPRATSRMVFRLRDETARADVAAYLATFR